jgi:hypothetical protein
MARVAIITLVVAACSQSPARRDPSVASRSTCARTDETQRLRETTQPTLSDRLVGIGNIFERDVPDASGVVAARLSAVLVITDPTTQQSRRETVIEGSVVTIGGDRYCVVELEAGTREPGWVSIRKL